MTTFHASTTQALVPQARGPFAEIDARGRAHRYALHVRSSQAFALNVFAPLSATGRVAFFVTLGFDVASVGEPEFEWEDPQNSLGEGGRNPRHVTQVDVVLRGTGQDGRRIVALVEVKFTEADFGGCSAYGDDKNPDREVCRTPGLFGGSPSRCFQLQDKGHGRRHYDTLLADVPVVASVTRDGGCCVRTGLNQPMRNLALAHALLQRHEADDVVFAVVAPAGHREVWRRVEELRAVFPDTATRRVVGVDAETVVRLHDDGGAELARRYPAPALEVL